MLPANTAETELFGAGINLAITARPPCSGGDTGRCSRCWQDQSLVHRLAKSGDAPRAVGFSDFFPTPVGDGIANFVEFDLVDESLDGFAGEAAFGDALGGDVAAFVAPAAQSGHP